tara:strand:- start:5 stop:1537 length:1533 start_codon:yes stop_codon:yes gene_type:complete
MLDLPMGVITEKRKGGPSVLSLLAKDLIVAKLDSYIRSEIKINNSISKIGYIVFRNGFPLMAMYSMDDVLHAADALEKIDDDAADLDCLLTVHRNIDVDLLLQTFPNSLLNLELNIDTESNLEWWKKKEIKSKTWTSSKVLPEQKFNTKNSPEFERALESRLRRIAGHKSSELYPGYAYLVKESNPSNCIKLASKLAEIEHEVMIISRLQSSRISQEFNLPIEMCFWLTEKSVKDEQTIGPQLELLYSEIKQFFENYKRSVIVLDGFEFLYAIHGKDRTLDFLRRLVDISTTSDDIAFIPMNLDVFDIRTKALIIRELDELNSEEIEDWLLSPEELEGHLFHLPDQQEIRWDEELNSIKSDIIKKINTPIPKKENFTPLKEIEINNEGSRLDLSGIIEKWDEEDLKNHNENLEVEEIITEINENEKNEVEINFDEKGPKSPTKVKFLGTKKSHKKNLKRGVQSNLEEAAKISKIRKNYQKDTDWKRKDENKTYRQYYDASKHKGKLGGED